MKKQSKTWIDQPVFALRDLLALTGYAKPRVQQWVLKGIFKPKLPQPHGRSRTAPDRQTYTPRDALRLALVGSAVGFSLHTLDGDRFGMNLNALTALTAGLDSEIKQFKQFSEVEAPLLKPRECERVIFTRPYSPWCYCTIDLGMLVGLQMRRLIEYKLLRDRGMRHEAAARESLRMAAAARSGSSNGS